MNLAYRKWLRQYEIECICAGLSNEDFKESLIEIKDKIRRRSKFKIQNSMEVTSIYDDCKNYH